MDIDFRIIFEEFNKGNAPLAHIDSKTFIGDKGQASDGKADVISRPSFLTQSPALANLTNGTEAGVVDQLIRYILEQPTDSAETITYAMGTTKLFKLNTTTVYTGGSPSWPQAVSGMTSGESIARLNGNIYGFYNKTSGGDILKMVLSTEVITAAWGSATDQALESAKHPSATKEDIMLFGNGQYVGTYIEGLATLDVRKLNFGTGAEVVDVLFHANAWWIAVNHGERRSQIYMYDGSALSNILSDEAGIGAQSIGFLYVVNGIIYVAYSDSTSGGYVLGYLAGRALKPMRYFSGSLPDYRQKTLYKNTIIFISSTDIWSFGASVNQLPAQISKLADAGHATVGALSAPFGTPLVASTDGSTGFRLAKFSGYSLDSNWKSILVDLTSDKNIGKVHTIIVYTKPLVGSAKATVQLEGNQGATGFTSTAFEVETADKTRHVFTSVDLLPVEDVRVIVSFAGGDATNDCPIRKIVLLGNFIER